MLNSNEKRPERVLSKNGHNEVICACGHVNISYGTAQNCFCQKCGQLLNWGLRKA